MGGDSRLAKDLLNEIHRVIPLEMHAPLATLLLLPALVVILELGTMVTVFLSPNAMGERFYNLQDRAHIIITYSCKSQTHAEAIITYVLLELRGLFYRLRK